ncbi:hypothetical protein [Falsihalocynthiibacter arcticus]|uniref:Uncharacterized protein n=1 Tax=Falsihalocynthiibacter arcticus TaxID=1579316 RepID=A0A126UXJ7_9RHOB|nr:hypothetical protein [Falsihalocynthiibacter arcticus]AML50415.1 hypothetical protein RC74_03280 [Falsihalocynthiibacter arcticus]
MKDNYLTPEEVSDRLDISLNRLEEMRREVDGPAYEVVDRKIVHTNEAVIAFEMEQMKMNEAVREADLLPWSMSRRSKKARKAAAKSRKGKNKFGWEKR